MKMFGVGQDPPTVNYDGSWYVQDTDRTVQIPNMIYFGEPKGCRFLNLDKAIKIGDTYMEVS